MIELLNAILLFIAVWTGAGHMIALSALSFLEIKPSLKKLFTGVFLGPLSLSKDWWMKP